MKSVDKNIQTTLAFGGIFAKKAKIVPKDISAICYTHLMKLIKYILILFLALFQTLSLSADQGNDSVAYPLETQDVDSTLISDHIFYEEITDSLVFVPPVFEQNFKEKYQSQDYMYDRTKNREKNKFFQWVQKILHNIFGPANADEPSAVFEFIIRLLVIFILIGAVFILVRSMTGQDGFSIFKKTSALHKSSLSSNSDAEHSNFDQLIHESLLVDDFRMAIRYNYLKTLHQLNEKQHIQMDADKTDGDYLIEIKNNALKERFRYLSYVYYYIWYGSFHMDRSAYDKAQIAFDQNFNLLKNG